MDLRLVITTFMGDASEMASNGQAILASVASSYCELLATLMSNIKDTESTDTVFYTNLACLVVILMISFKALRLLAHVMVFPATLRLRYQLRREKTKMAVLDKRIVQSLDKIMQALNK